MTKQGKSYTEYGGGALQFKSSKEHRCVKAVKAQGKSESSARAICKSAVGGKRKSKK